MLNKSSLILFAALSIGLWLGASLPLFSDDSSGSFVEELLKLNNIAGALIGGAVGAIVSYYFEKRRKKRDSDA